MKTIRSEQVWMFDIDDTLVLWDGKQESKTISMWDEVEGRMIWLRANQNNIRLLKEKKARGCFIIVWTQGGWSYGEAVIKALCLQDYVDIIMSKPAGIVDDLPVEVWAPKNVNIDPNKPYKI